MHHWKDLFWGRFGFGADFGRLLGCFYMDLQDGLLFFILMVLRFTKVFPFWGG